MKEKEENVVQKIVSILSENKCTVAEAKSLLNAAEKTILEQATVQYPTDIYFDTPLSISRSIPEILEILEITKNDRPGAFQER